MCLEVPCYTLHELINDNHVPRNGHKGQVCSEEEAVAELKRVGKPKAKDIFWPCNGRKSNHVVSRARGNLPRSCLLRGTFQEVGTSLLQCCNKCVPLRISMAGWALLSQRTMAHVVCGLGFCYDEIGSLNLLWELVDWSRCEFCCNGHGNSPTRRPSLVVPHTTGWHCCASASCGGRWFDEEDHAAVATFQLEQDLGRTTSPLHRPFWCLPKFGMPTGMQSRNRLRQLATSFRKVGQQALWIW